MDKHPIARSWAFPHSATMSPLEHAFTLQNMLTAIPFSGIFALFIALLVSLSIIPLVPLPWGISFKLLEPHIRPPARKDRFISRHSLQDAFSNGILNSKAF